MADTVDNSRENGKKSSDFDDPLQSPPKEWVKFDDENNGTKEADDFSHSVASLSNDNQSNKRLSTLEKTSQPAIIEIPPSNMTTVELPKTSRRREQDGFGRK